MSYVFEIPDEVYETLAEVAARQGRTPEEAFRSWVAQMRAQAGPIEPTKPKAREMRGEYDASLDPLAQFLGAFEADAPDVVRRHDAYLGEAYADRNDAGE
ncbi:MAG TPA: hypothetical protein VF120_07315 [Ktedonobacterales bacterium]